MPRQSKGPRLWLRPARKRKGKLIAKATWLIRDGSEQIATGCAQDEVARAEGCLSDYIDRKHRPTRSERDVDRIPVADVLSVYLDDCALRELDLDEVRPRIARLNEFFGDRSLSEVNGGTCREYTLLRGSRGGARRDLEDLRAAINFHEKEGFHRGRVRVSLPPKGAPRDRWLTRAEAARLLWTCWRQREVQTVHRGVNKGKPVATRKRPSRHLARFILIGLYTGTRAGAIASASVRRDDGRSFVDLQQGVFYRLARGRRASNKRQPPVPIPPRLLAHMRRWVAKGIVTDHFVEWNGKPIASVKVGLDSAAVRAELDGRVTPHVLRHTAATWLMQAGVDKWEAAGFLGMTVEMIDKIYGHHHPDHLRNAAKAIGYRPTRVATKPAAAKPETSETVVISVVERLEERRRQAQVVEIVGGGRSPAEPVSGRAIPC